MLRQWTSWTLLLRLCCLSPKGHLGTAFAYFVPRTAISNGSAAIVTQSPYTGGYYTYSTFLEAGSVVLELPSGNSHFPTTIYGPTHFTYPYPTAGSYVLAGSDTADPHCHSTISAPPFGRYLTVAVLFTVLTAGQTITANLPQDVTTGTLPPTRIFENRTITGPTTVSLTRVVDLYGPEVFNNGLESDVYIPGMICGGTCGRCQVYFSTVNVYYWPVTSQNTACLVSTAVSNTMAVTKRNVRDGPPRGITVEPRSLDARSGSASTIVNSNGFTFISPSVYIEFPSIKAVDGCGTLGQVHTSTTLGFPEGSLSTLVFNEGVLNVFPFDFKDALCPPETLANFHTYSFVGQTGYRPVISAPPGLTNLDPAWVANCEVPAFQGNDPPYALQPAVNLSPSPTPADPGAGPNTPVPTPAAPIQTPPPPPPPSSTMFSPPTVVAKPPNDPSTPTQHAQAPHPPQDPQPPALPVLQDPKQPPNNPQQTPAKSPSPITTNAASALQIGSRTLTPGGAPIIFSGTTYALAPSASVIIINGIPTALPAAAPNPTPIEVSGQALTTNAASALMIGTQTLTPGGPAITLSGTTYALAPSASALTVNGIPTQLPAPAAPIQILNQPLTTNAASFLMIGTQTLIAGGPAITISNTPISLDPSGSFLVIGSSTQKLGTGLPSSGQNTTPIPTPAPNYSGEKLTFQGTTYTADSKGDFVIGTQTLTPGGLVTVGGTRISLDRTPTVAVVGTGTQGLGGLIVQPFKAAAGRRLGWGRGVVRLVGLIVAGVML